MVALAIQLSILKQNLPCYNLTSPLFFHFVTQILNAGGDFDVFHQATLSLLLTLLGRRSKYTKIDRFKEGGESFADFVRYQFHGCGNE